MSTVGPYAIGYYWVPEVSCGLLPDDESKG